MRLINRYTQKKVNIEKHQTTTDIELMVHDDYDDLDEYVLRWPMWHVLCSFCSDASVHVFNVVVCVTLLIVLFFVIFEI